MQKRFKILLLTLLTASSATLSAAPMGYSVNSDSGSDDDHDSLYLVDLATGGHQRIGTLTLDAITLLDVEGLAIHPDGQLHGVDDETLKLFPILVGANSAVADTSADHTISGLTRQFNDFGMTFDCDGNLYISSVKENKLYSLDPATGASSEIGALDANISALAAYGKPAKLYGLGNGTLGENAAAVARLYEIDTSTGAANPIGPLGPAAGAYAEGGLAFDSDGQLWAITDRRPSLLPSQVMRINTSTGTASDVLNTVEQGFESLAISAPQGCAPIASGERATFIVQKRFEDDNNVTPVELKISCNDGLPSSDSQTVLPNEGVFGQAEMTFIVMNFADGALNCEVWEEIPAGYTAEYDCQSASGCTTGEALGPCTFNGVGIGQENLCLIQNRVDPVELTVTKEWLYPREELVVDDDAVIKLFCNGVFDGDGEKIGGGMKWSWVFDGNPDSRIATVFPDFAGTTECWTEETSNASAVETSSSCSDPITINLGDGQRNCIVTNAIFFEGIPTVNEYGLILISALMLMTGLITVRRIG